MSNHRPPTDPGASVASIVTGVAATTITLALVTYILWGPLDDRDLIGAGLGFLLTLLLFAQTVMRISDRLTARDRIRTYRRRQEAEAARLARMAQRAEPEPDPMILDHWASGGEQPEQYDPEPTWPSPSGWPVPIVQANPEPEYPEARYPQWPEAVDTGVIDRPDYLIQAAEATLADQTGEVGTETQRIDYPSPAALRSIDVPVFRTEAERAAWAHPDDDQS